LQIKTKVLQQQPQTIQVLIENAEQCLLACSDSAKLDAQILLCFVLDKEHSYLLTWPEKIVNQQSIEQFHTLLQRRITGEPIAYIIGVKEFWSLPFYVSPATLIPRPDTEILVELVLDMYECQSGLSCLDLGTGTGAIALSLASEFPDWEIDALDFSLDAVQLAKKNAEHLTLTHVNIYQSDWFSTVPKTKKFNIIVSNPPYIDELDHNLKHGDVRFEPKSALVADDKGLADIKYIANLARDYLVKQGTIFFEHGFDQGDAVRKLLNDLGYKKAKTVKDLNNHDRITWAVYC
jgi:release factor glutamine methyltransferase